MIFLASIVEGHGEVEAVPALLHRVAAATGASGRLLVNPPIRVKVGSFLNDPEYRRKQVLLASAKAAERKGAVLILLDCDDQCPAQLGPELYRQTRELRNDTPLIVSLAYREYESWFLAAARSFAGRHGIPADIAPPADHETIRGAKEWLSRRMENGYDPIVHQAELSRAMDLTEARSNKSFDRLFKKLEELFRELNNAGLDGSN